MTSQPALPPRASHNAGTDAYSDYLGPAVPADWRQRLDPTLEAGEKVLASVVLDLDTALRFRGGLLAVTDRRLLAELAAGQGRIVDAEPPPGLPPVLVGDFNAQPDATEIRFLKGLHALEGRSVFFADCFGVAGEGPGYTFDATRNPFAAPTHEYPRRIDYVFVRGPDKKVRGKPLEARVVMQEIEGGVCASDHYGVYAEVSI